MATTSNYGTPRTGHRFGGGAAREGRVTGRTGPAVPELGGAATLARVALCPGYQGVDDLHDASPGDRVLLERAAPVYEWFDGWRTSTAGARTLADLPAGARRYLDRIRELADTPIAYVSVGTHRDQIIEVA